MTTTSKETKAVYRLVVTDNAKTKRVVVGEYHSGLFNPSNGDLATKPSFEDDMQKLPIMPKGMGGVLREDDYLLIEAKDDGSTQSIVLDDANKRLRIPVTARNRRTGIVTERVLSPADFTIVAQAADMSATYWTEIANIKIPAQEEWKLGVAIAHNSRVLIGFGDTVGAA